MTRRIAPALLLSSLASLACPRVARAELMLGALTGYAQGSLNRRVAEPFTTFSTLGYVGYNIQSFNVHAFVQHMSLAYRTEGETYSGVYALSGVGAGYSAYRQAGRVTVLAEAPLTGSYTVLSESSGTVNGSNYVHSTLTTLSGGTAAQVFVGYEFLVDARLGRRKAGENLWLGVFVGYLQQSFATASTRIKTNNSVLAPPSPGKERVSWSATVTSLDVSVNYDL